MNKYKVNVLWSIVPVILVAILVFTGFKTEKNAVVKFKNITTIESVIPGGFGRSRLIISDNQGSSIDESKLLNFYSLVGINFDNIGKNDQAIVSQIQDLTNQGWELVSVNGGVQSPNEKSNNGIFITRYLFKKTDN